MGVEIVPMEVQATAIPGLCHVRTKAVTDERGTVREFFRASAFAAAGVDVPAQWAQVNLTHTERGAVRGLHGESVQKLIGLAAGEAFGVYLDARPDSSAFGRVVTVELRVGMQLFVPAGVCNGFQATSAGGCQYLYCFGVEWTPDMAGIAVHPLDPALAIAWPIPIDTSNRAMISAKDLAAPRLAELSSPDRR